MLRTCLVGGINNKTAETAPLCYGHVFIIFLLLTISLPRSDCVSRWGAAAQKYGRHDISISDCVQFCVFFGVFNWSRYMRRAIEAAQTYMWNRINLVHLQSADWLLRSYSATQ
jgi:hypothetical protein